MSRQTRTFQLRAPLVIQNKMRGVLHYTAPVLQVVDGEEKTVNKKCSKPGWVPVTPTFVNDRMNPTGGATVLITGDPDDGSGLVEVQVTFCRPDEPFSRKQGRQQAATKDKEVIKVTDIPREMLEIEHQMLCQFNHYLRKHSEVRRELTRPNGWSYAMYFFLPKDKEQAHG